MGRKAISEYQVKFSKQSNAGKHWYIIGRPNGQRRRAWFPTKETARAEATERNNQMRQFGESAVTLSGVLANMAIECQTQLQKYDKNLSDATRFYLQHLEALDNSIPLHQLTAAIRAEFQRRLAAGECSHRHWEGMRYALRKLDQQYGQRDAQTLEGSEIKSWLAAAPWASQTRNGLLAYFSLTFNIAKELKLLNANPLLGIKRFAMSKVSKKSFPKVLSVPQLTALLNAADSALRPYLSICAFAGLRSAECKSLTWEAVDLQRGIITVPEHISKTGQERKIPISENLAAWLNLRLVPAESYIYPRDGHSENLKQLLQTAKEQAGLWPWRPRYQNALRKSFCSYHYELHGSANRTSEYAGHDIRMLIKVYRHAVEHEEAEKYWNIYPT
jgi:integrase